MKTIFPKKELHVPKWFILDATGKTLGRLSTEASKLLRGKENSHFTPGVDLGNFVVIINANKIVVSGNKETEKLYYRNSQTPGNLKIETFKDLKNRIPTRILERSIWGMLPKGVLGREYFRRLYVYSADKIIYKKTSNQDSTSPNSNVETNWIKVDL